MQTPCSIDDYRVIAIAHGVYFRFLADRYRVFYDIHRECLDIDLLSQLDELVYSRRPVYIGGHQQGFTPHFSDMDREFRRSCRLAGALQSDQHDRHRRGRGYIERFIGAPEDLAKLIVDDLDELLPGRNARKHIFAHGLFLDLLKEILRDLEIDIGFQKRYPDFTQRVFDVAFCKLAVSPDLLEGRFKSFL